MGKCGKVTCSCGAQVKKCQLKDGVCPSCYIKRLNEAKKKG